MKIESSTVSMASTRGYHAETEAAQTVVMRRYDGGTSAASMGLSHAKRMEGQVTSVTVTHSKTTQFQGSSSAAVYVSSGGGLTVGDQREGELHSTRTEPERRAPAEHSAIPAQTASVQKGIADWLSELDNDPVIQMLRKCLEMLERATGHPISQNTRLGGRRVGEYLHLGASYASASYRQTMTAFQAGRTSIAPANAGANPNGYWTRQAAVSGVSRGEEHTSFTSTGTAVTADGRTIDFGITVGMSRSFETAFDMVGKEAVYTDPLIVNLDTDAASLGDVSFFFDLNCDGTAEELSSLGEGSGFLALDKNGDGVINDGSELFGAKTGDGFAELAQYDQDGNGWIDENDEVFSRLSVWAQCGDGEPRLLSLSEADVGAIFLGSRETQFTLTDSSGREGAMVRRTGVYLRESGSAGTVQHVDLKM